jgi:hypothetical protein
VATSAIVKAWGCSARERRIEVDVMGNPNQRMASEYSLQELGLTPGMKFVYEYDYGTTSTVKMT